MAPSTKTPLDLNNFVLPAPKLTPSFCYTPFALRTFVRQSRLLSTDLVLRQPSFIQPAKQLQFFTIDSAWEKAGASKIPLSKCADFMENILLPASEARSKVFDYCWKLLHERDMTKLKQFMELGQKYTGQLFTGEGFKSYSVQLEVSESMRRKLIVEIAKEAELEAIVAGKAFAALLNRCEGLKESMKEGD